MTRNVSTQTPQTLAAAPFTPSELAAPNPALHRAANARLEALLTKHEPRIFPAWAARMEAEGQGRDTNPVYGPSLLYIAVVMLMMRRDRAVRDQQAPSPDTDRRFRRNREMLIKLVLRGVRRRGEA